MPRSLIDEVRLIEKIDEKKDFTTFDDGYVYWCPGNHGGFSPWMLRAIAAELDRRNAEWDAKVNEYFDSISPPADPGTDPPKAG